MKEVAVYVTHNPVAQFIFAAMLLYWTCYLVHFIVLVVIRPDRHEDRPMPTESYQLWLLLPAWNEEAVIGRSVSLLTHELSLLPATVEGHVLVMDDASGDRTGELALEAGADVVSIPAARAHRGKGSVLNQGMEWIGAHRSRELDERHVIIGVIDADGSMGAQDMAAVLSAFESRRSQGHEVDMVQTAVEMRRKTGILERSQEWEFRWANRKQQLLRNRYGDAIASGNGQFVTYRLASEVQWGDGLLEDMEYTLRCWLKGRSTCFIDDAVVVQEAVSKPKAYLRQRVRWCMGGIQCSAYLPEVLPLDGISLLQKASLVVTIFSPTLAPLIFLGNVFAFLTQVLLVISGFSPEGLITLTGIWLILVIVAALDQHLRYMPERGVPTLMADFMAFQAVNLVPGSAVAPVSLVRLAMGRTSWSKTTHTGG